MGGSASSSLPSSSELSSSDTIGVLGCLGTLVVGAIWIGTLVVGAAGVDSAGGKATSSLVVKMSTSRRMLAAEGRK